MEGLMSEATDLILSSPLNAVPGPDKILKSESGNVTETPKDSTTLSSVTLLRLSITNSIKDRGVEVEVPGDKTSKSNKHKRRKEAFTRNPEVDVQFLNSELAAFYPERKASAEKRDSPHEQNKANITTKVFTELLNNKQAPDPVVTGNVDTKENDTDNCKKNEICLEDEEQKKRKKIAQNGLKLASRRFSDSIFENCSTYSLACPELLQERENIIPPKQDLAVNEQPLTENVPKTEDHGHSDDKRSSIASENDSCSEDQIELSDSFFFDVTREDSGSQSYFFYREGENSSAKRNSVKGSSFNDLTDLEDNLHSSQKRERRLSKKLRKRNKKAKSKDVPMYECPKCGVLYVLSSKTSESTARCLHCDFWTSVEPEFVKRGKQPWNTCRIC